MMKRRLLYAVPVILAMLVSIALGITFASPADAITKCDTVVADEAGVFNSDRSLVEEAANRLASRGADVHAVTIQSYAPSSSLADYIEDLWRSCPSWKVGNDLRQDLILVIYSVGGVVPRDRGVQIYIGDTWLAALPSYVRDEIQKDMVPLFLDNEPAAAFTSSFDDLTQAIDEARSGSVGSPQGDQGGYVPYEPRDRSGSFDWSIVGQILLWVFSGVVVIAFLVWLVRFIMRKLDERRQRLESLAATVSTRMSANDLMTELTSEERERTRDSIVEKYGYAPEVQTELGDAADAFADYISVAQDRLTEADELYPDLYPGCRLTLAQAVEAESAFEMFAKSVRDADKQDSMLLAMRDKIDAEIAAKDTTITLLNERLVAYNGLVDQFDRDGVRFERGDVVACQSLLDRAKDGEETIETLKDVKAATELLDTLHGAYDEFAKVYKHAKQLQADLHAKILEINTVKPEAVASFARLSEKYVESCWKEVSGSNDEASRLLSETEQSVIHIDQLIIDQQWSQSVSASLIATKQIDRAAALFDGVLKREADVLKAEQSAPQVIEDARKDIKKAERYIDQYDEDINESLEDDLRSALEIVDGASNELSKDRPDFLVVIRMALEADSRADRIYELAVGEHEAAMRLRRLLETEVAQAEARINQADMYIMLHAGDVSFTARNYLTNAKEELANAKARLGEADADAVDDAREASSWAEDAHDQAERDVHAANAARAAAAAALAAQAEQARRASVSTFSNPSGGGGGRGGTGHTTSF